MANFYGNLAHQVESDGDSDISDVDPLQLAKMVEDVDDLDAGLFGSSLNKNIEKQQSKGAAKSALKSPSTDERKQQKSHVTFGKKKTIDFGDFDADDPLGDLLSDEDDDLTDKKEKISNIKSSVTPTRKQDSGSESTSKQNKAKVIAELFGLEEEKKQSQPIEDDKNNTADWLGLKDSQPAATKPPLVSKTPVITPEKDGDDEDGGDLLSGMGFDTEKQSSKPSQPKSKLDELLGKSTSSSTDSASRSMLDDLLVKNPSRERLSGGDGRRSNPQQPQPQQSTSNVSFGGYSPSLSNPGRRHGRRNSGTPAIPDPLGIFTPTSSPSKEVSSHQPVVSNPGNKPVDWLGISDTTAVSSSTVAAAGSPDRRRRGGEQPLPDWLGGGGGVVTDTTQPAPQPQPAVPTAPLPVPTPAPAIGPVQPQVPSQPVPILNTGGGVGVLMAGSQMDQQVVSALQHQEMQLLTALHLKQHEERLSALQVRQQEMLQRQEKQLEELIRRQMDRQEQLDLHMRTQQDRINSHIQLLLTQPVMNPVPPTPSATPSHSSTLDQKADDAQISEEHTEVQKRHLESTLESLQAKHLEEMQLLEDSYRRQISLLEASSERQEQRLRLENERLEKEYQTRIARMQEEQANVLEQQQSRLAAVQKEHTEELQQLRESHRLNLEEARKQHSDMLEHLNKARALESEALKEASSYSRSLHTALEQLGRNSQELSGLQVELSGQHHMIRENLEKQRVASEEERKRLIELVSQLEQKLAEQKQTIEEERWSLRQEASRLESATKSLEKERERTMQQIEREKQQLHNLKESMLSEQQMLNEQLQQEKLSLASEKSRLDTLAKLHGTNSPDVAKLRAELEASLKVAQEASRQAELEHEKLRNQQHRLDEDRRRLDDLEHELTSRARELETLTKMAVATREEGRRALEEARRIEFQFSERSADVQRQLAELRDREKRLAQEKIIVSQERLTLQHEKSRVLCSYCRRPAAVPISPPATPPDLDKKFVDPKVIIMKLAAEDEASRLEQESRFLSSHFSVSK
ncbi:hypothetical protein C0J52_15996 [Blattella germanica]|nr:hypothetical protein C0J52_15996 [Blattella germanica]